MLYTVATVTDSHGTVYIWFTVPFHSETDQQTSIERAQDQYAGCRQT